MIVRCRLRWLSYRVALGFPSPVPQEDAESDERNKCAPANCAADDEANAWFT